MGGKIKKNIENDTKQKELKDKTSKLFGLGTIIDHIKKNWVDVKNISKNFKISDEFKGNQLP
jgi:hypothetical protein